MDAIEAMHVTLGLSASSSYVLQVCSIQHERSRQYIGVYIMLYTLVRKRSWYRSTSTLASLPMTKMYMIGTPHRFSFNLHLLYFLGRPDGVGCLCLSSGLMTDSHFVALQALHFPCNNMLTHQAALKRRSPGKVHLPRPFFQDGIRQFPASQPD